LLDVADIWSVLLLKWSTVGQRAGPSRNCELSVQVPVRSAHTSRHDQRNGVNGELSDSIATGSAGGGELVIVGIDATDAGFNSDGCGSWTLVG